MVKGMLRSLVGSPLYSRMGWLKRNGLYYYPICPYLEIDGWLSLNEAMSLYDLARTLQGDEPVVVELGVWQGKSAFVLAQGLKDKPGAKNFCIDPFNADGDPASTTLYHEKSRSFERPLKDGFLEICESYGFRERIEVLQGYSYDFSSSWDTPIDLLFIDANHTFEAVKRDYLEWSNFVREGGFIAFHDVFFQEEKGEWSGPGAVVHQHLLFDERFVTHKFIDSLFIAKRVSGAPRLESPSSTPT
jgi:predicted O-methyltransferase YrrM